MCVNSCHATQEKLFKKLGLIYVVIYNTFTAHYQLLSQLDQKQCLKQKLLHGTVVFSESDLECENTSSL